MKKRTSRILSLFLCLMMVTNLFMVSVSAATETTVEEIPNGTVTITITTEEKTDDQTGAVTRTETTVEETTVVNPDGSTYDAQKTTTETAVETENGIPVSGSYVEEGKEIWKETVDVDVTVPLVPGEDPVTVTGGKDGQTVTGNRKNGEDDPNYDQTTVTDIPREVTAETSKVEMSIDSTGKNELDSIASQVFEKNESFVKDMDLSDAQSYKPGPGGTSPIKEQPAGYDFKRLGVGTMSKWLVNTNQGVGGAFLHTIEDVTGGEGEIFSAYCVDHATSALKQHWYRIDNLEDAGYYDEETAKYIRAVALNGYWATAPEQDADGNQTAIGSLEKIKQDMKQAVADGRLTSGEMTAEELNAQIDSITEGMALNATQAAIWSYANGIEVTNLLNTYVGALSKPYQSEAAATDAEKAAANLMYEYLTNLDPMEANPSTTTQIIDQDSVTDLSITVGDRLTNGKTTTVDGQTVENDNYEVSVSFALVVKTDNEDNLVVRITSADGTQTLAEARLAGSADDGIPTITPDADGKYVISGLEVAENEDFSFSLTLEGTQYLEQGVYIYTPYGDDYTASQTLVGIAQGTKEVNVSAGVTVNFQVEDAEQIKEREWRRTRTYNREDVDPDEDDPIDPPVDPVDPPVDPVNPPVEPVNPPVNPVEEIPDEDVPLAEIPDEEVPLAAVPQTGDASVYFAILSALSGTGLAGLALTKKRDEE